jgi:predicted nucleic acid-binding protein
MNALDTNIWVYSHDTRDPLKQQTAKQVIATVRPLALPWQVGCEFIAACRKLQGIGFTEDQAWLALATMRATVAEILLPDPQLWDDTKDLQGRYALSFWDALLAASCIRGGVHTLYSEDFGASPVIDSLTIVNPFAVP